MKKHNYAKEFAFLGVMLILLLMLLFSILQILENTVLHRDEPGEPVFVSKTIVRDGVEYFPRQDITTVLVMGIDQQGAVEDSGSYMNTGATDMNALLVFDEERRSCCILYLNRDTMLEMPVLGIGGKRAGTSFGQLALSHTYGSGLADSCENTRETISDFLYGLQIDHYVSVHMDAIPILNDAVGGVTVHVTDDFSQVDPSITMGDVTLRGQQAISFVRTRKGLGDQLNVSRIRRQSEYIDCFAEAFRAKWAYDENFILSAYEKAEPYLVTDCSVNAIVGMVERYSDYEYGGVILPEGENVRGEEYMEFYVDEEKLDELILELFYAPKE